MAEPVSLDEAKAQCRVTTDDEDSTITALSIAAREWVENYTGYVLDYRQITEAFSSFADLSLSKWPVDTGAPVVIQYLDTGGIAQTIEDVRLLAVRRPARLVPAIGGVWPATYADPEAVTITYQAGYASADMVPRSLREAILIHLEAFYDHSSLTGDEERALESLCRQHRLAVIG